MRRMSGWRTEIEGVLPTWVLIEPWLFLSRYPAVITLSLPLSLRSPYAFCNQYRRSHFTARKRQSRATGAGPFFSLFVLNIESQACMVQALLSVPFLIVGPDTFFLRNPAATSDSHTCYITALRSAPRHFSESLISSLSEPFYPLFKPPSLQSCGLVKRRDLYHRLDCYFLYERWIVRLFDAIDARLYRWHFIIIGTGSHIDRTGI